jgi:carbon-monoxide dehydrogenase iron sulfur subunit
MELMKRLTCDNGKCLACRSCEIACAIEHSESKTLVGAIQEFPLPIYRVRVLAAPGEGEADGSRGIPLRCRHCEEPECVFACKSGALTRDLQSGAILCDESRCVGCWMCVMACPLGSLRPSGRGVALKCDLCFEKKEPACVEACPTHALRCEEVEAERVPSASADHRGLTHVMIGASAAGVSAAEAVREADRTARILVVSEEADPLYSCFTSV